MPRRAHALAILALLLGMVMPPARAHGRPAGEEGAAPPLRGARFQIRPAQDDNRVTFRSEAPLESFEGRTDEVAGEFTARLNELVGPMTGSITVELADLDTGIGLRNTHMRQNHLETDSYPQAVFRPQEVVTSTVMTLRPGLTAQTKVAGTMSLHGVTRPLECQLEVKRQPDGALDITGEFTVRLSDYLIKRPQFLVMKLADEQRISLRLHAVPVAQEVP